MSDVKIMRLRYAGVCVCGAAVAQGERAGWDRTNRRIVCSACLAAPEETLAPDAGTPGESLMREFDRRKAGREKRVRARFPRLGGFLLAISDEPSTTTAFKVGAEGEQRMAARFERDCPDVLFLHNRRRGTDSRLGDIDHIAVTAAGVFIIDPKNYKNAKVDVIGKGLLSRRPERLMIRGHNRTSLVESLQKQQIAVETALRRFDGLITAPVAASFCFIDAPLPVFKTLRIQGFDILGPRATVKRLNKPGNLSADQRDQIWRHLAAALPAA